MHITLNTDNITDVDRAILALVLGEAPTVAAVAAVELQQDAEVERLAVAARPEEEKPKRTRRSPAQKKADDEAEAAKAAAGDPETPAEEPTTGVTLEQVTEVGTRLIAKDRAAMVELLGEFVEPSLPKRISNVAPERMGAFHEAILEKLA